MVRLPFFEAGSPDACVRVGQASIPGLPEATCHVDDAMVDADGVLDVVWRPGEEPVIERRIVLPGDIGLVFP